MTPQTKTTLLDWGVVTIRIFLVCLSVCLSVFFFLVFFSPVLILRLQSQILKLRKIFSRGKVSSLDLHPALLFYSEGFQDSRPPGTSLFCHLGWIIKGRSRFFLRVVQCSLCLCICLCLDGSFLNFFVPRV